jgi:hypothetical protein
MGKKSDDAPRYPVELMTRQLDESVKAGDRYMALSEQQQQWTQDMWSDHMLPMLQGVTGTQTDVMRQQMANAQEDRARYQDVYQPIEDDLIREFEEYDSPERRNMESGRAMAGVQQAFDAQRGNAEERLAAYGVDPSQVKGGALDLSARVSVAAQQAAQGNMARQRVEDTGRSLRAEAINIGRGMPSQVAAAYGQTLNAGNSAMGNMNSTMGQGANMMGTGGSWGQMGSNQLNSTMSGINNMYSGQLAGHAAQGPSGMETLGNVAGQAFGAWAGTGFAEGGGSVGQYGEGGGQALPLQNSDLSSTPGPNDKIPVTLAEDEFVVPADVAKWMGTEKLYKMVETSRQKAGEVGGANMNTPPGEMPNPEPPIKGQTLAAEGGGAVGNFVEPQYQALPKHIPPGVIAANVVPPAAPMAMGDPFAAHPQVPPSANPLGMDLAGSMKSGEKIMENMEEGKGLPGMMKDWFERRSTNAAAAKLNKELGSGELAAIADLAAKNSAKELKSLPTDLTTRL